MIRFYTALALTLFGADLCAAAETQSANSESPVPEPPASDSSWTHDFRIGPRVGTGEIRIENGQRIGDEIVSSLVSDETIGLGATLEYKAPFGLVVEGGLFRSASADWFDFDGYQLSEYFGSVGFEIPLGKGFTLTPRVGRSRWKIEAGDAWFFVVDDNPPTARGYQNYWEITALKRINDVVALGVSHRENDYDFGRIRSTVFTAMFSL